MNRTVRIADLLVGVGVLGAMIAVHNGLGVEFPRLIFVYLLIAAVLGDWVVGPIHVLVHELGHGIATVALTGGRVYIVVGHSGSGIGFSLGRIDVLVGSGSEGGRCELPRRISRAQLGVIAAAGPLASGILLALCVWGITLATGHSALLVTILVVAAVIAGTGVLNIVPMHFKPRYGGTQLEAHRSDGMLVLIALTGRIAEPMAPTPGERFIERTSPATRTVLLDAVRNTSDPSTPITAGDLVRALASSGAAPFLTGIAPLPAAAAGAPTSRPFSAPVARAINRAPSYLSLRGDPVVEPEHLLLALLAEPELDTLGIDRPAVRAKLLAHLG